MFYYVYRLQCLNNKRQDSGHMPKEMIVSTPSISFGHHDETAGRTQNYLGGLFPLSVVLFCHCICSPYFYAQHLHRRILFCSVLFLCISIMARKQKNAFSYIPMIHSWYISAMWWQSLRFLACSDTYKYTDRFCVGSRTTNRRRRDFMLEKWNTHKNWRR